MHSRNFTLLPSVKGPVLRSFLFACLLIPPVLSAQPDIQMDEDFQLVIDQAGDGEIRRGDTVEFDLTVTNQGSGNAVAVEIDNALHEHLDLDTASIEISPMAVDDEYPNVPGNNTFVPLAFHEGYAQWFESAGTAQGGRAGRRHPLFEGLWQQEYERGFRHYTEVFEAGNNESIGMAYLYGAYFFTRLAERFGDDVISDWIEARTERHGFWANLISPFNLDIAWRQQFDEPLRDSWAEFLAHEEARLAAHQAAEYPHQATTQAVGLSTFRRPHAVWRQGDWLAWRDEREGLRRPALQVAGPDDLTRRHAGYRPEQIVGSPPQGSASGVLWFNQLENCNGRPLYSLYRLDPAQGQPRRVDRCGRSARLAWHGERRELVTWDQTESGSELRLRDASGAVQQTLLEGDFGVQIKAVGWHPAGDRLLLTLKPEVGAHFDLYVLSLASNRLTALTRNDDLPHGAHWADQNTILYSLPRRTDTGLRLLQAYQWQPEAGLRQPLTRLPENVHQPQWLSGSGETIGFLAESGRAYGLKTVPVLPDAGTETAEPFSGDWEVPAGLRAERQRSDDTEASEPAEPEQRKSRDPDIHPYYAIEHMSPALLAPFPYFEDELGIGLTAEWREPTENHLVRVTASLGLFSGDFAGSLAYRFYEDWSLGVGQTRRGEDLFSGYRAGWQRTLWSGHRQRIDSHLEWVTDQRLERIDQATLRRRWAGTGLGYAYSERSRDRYDPNRALGLGLDYERSVGHADSNRVRLTARAQGALWRQHSLQASTRLLWTDDAQRPFSAGRTGAYSVFPRPIGSTVPLRALPEPLDSAELLWARPQLRLLLAEPDRSLGTWGLGLSSLWLVPYAATAWDFEQEARYNVGAELELRFSTLWLASMQATLGYAHNPEEDRFGAVYFSFGPRWQ